MDVLEHKTPEKEGGTITKSPISHMKILYVEDDSETREQLTHFLRRKVRVVHPAGNGEDALEILDREPVDLILTDSRMPVMDGPTMIRKIREAGNRTPVILLSAYTQEELDDKYEPGMVNQFMTKPVDLQKLIHVINESAQDPSQP